MNYYFCSSCRKDRKHNLFIDVTLQIGCVLQVLGSCKECNKGRWIEISEKRLKELEHERNKK